MEATSRALITHDVGLSYRQGLQRIHALRHVSLRVEAPEFVGIHGPSGSGKSSLLYLLGGLKRPTAGWVEALGHNLSTMGPEARNRLRRAMYGIIFQQPFLIHYLTAAENVAVGAARPDRTGVREAERLLARLGMSSLAQRRPHELSGGQRQRVAAARALVNQPTILLADEPTASLDHHTGQELMSLLREYCRAHQALIVVVTHDTTITAGADRIIQLWDGQQTGEDGAGGSARPEHSAAPSLWYNAIW